MNCVLKHRQQGLSAGVHAAEVFESGGITLWRGDSLQLLPSVPAGSIDAVITDPPYCSGGTTTAERMKDPAEKYCQGGNTRGRPTFAGDTRDQRSFKFWCTLWLTACRQAAKPSAYCLVFIDWRQLPSMTDCLQAAGWTWRGVVAWNKGLSARAPHKGYFRHQCEYICWATNGAAPQPTDRGPFPGCYDIPVKRDDKWHITGKPTALMRELVQIVPPQATILDPFAGSATTGVAATLEQRHFIGIEASPDYFVTGRERLQAAIGGTYLLR